MIKQYKISVPKSTLNEIYKKVRNFPWTAAQNMNGWEYGTNLNYLKSISKYWITNYSWKKFENKINSFKNYKTKVEDINLHFIFEKSKNPNSRPLLLLHGWPGSISEFLDIIPRKFSYSFINVVKCAFRHTYFVLFDHQLIMTYPNCFCLKKRI